MTELRITEFTDPGCPWAWSAEPARRRLDWLFGEGIAWHLRMVGLSASPAEYEDKGFTPERMAQALAEIGAAHHMPMATGVRPRMAATLPACRAIVAVREHEGEQRARALLRRLRVRHFAGEALDDGATVAGAARESGLDPDALRSWMAAPHVEAALEADMAAARAPADAALALDHKLADAEAGRRYTCPSYELERLDGSRHAAIPGFQPFAVYEVAVANFGPGLRRRPAPQSVVEVLEWAGEPLATAEVAAVCELPLEQAREELGRVAVERHLGAEGLWALPRYGRESSAAGKDRASATTASAAASSAGE